MATRKNAEDISVSSICIQVGRRIAEFRQAKGWSQRMLADHAQIEQAHLARLELGQKEAGLLMLEKIADALEVSLSDLLKGL
ncbi:MAG TPA: helix-turn-helix transcriptional regulator [Acidobacteriaceae bacterium]